MKSSTSTLFKVLLLLGLFIILVILYFKLFLKENKYRFNYFQSVITINLGDDQNELSSTTLKVIDNLLKSQENKWFPKKDSYIVNLNNNLASGNSFQVDNETINLINKIKGFQVSSNGYFNPAIGKLLNTGDKDNNNSLDLNDFIAKMPKPQDIKIENNTISCNNPMLQLNINGIITAHILIQIKDVLLDNKIQDAVISMGNDSYVIKSNNEQNYRVIAKNTSSKKMPKLMLKVYNNEFLSTSGIFIKDYNNIVRTIINPKTGKPADGFYGSTVIGNDPYIANVASIALIIAGKDNFKSVAESLGINDYILYTYDNKIIISNSMRNRIS